MRLACLAGALALGCSASRAARLARAPLVRVPRLLCRAAAGAAGGGGRVGSGADETAAAHADRVVQLHREIAESTPAAPASGTGAGDASARAAHNARQAAVFDAAVGWFASPAATPADVEPRLRRIAAAAVPLPPSGSALSEPPRVLDVGCGTGALVPFLKERCGTGAPPAAGRGAPEVVCLDLSPKMAALCAERHGVTAICADVVDWAAEQQAAGRAGCFDSVVFNAVFANMHSQRQALAAACTAARPRGGRVVISHPLGRAFVSRLSAEDGSVVPHGLPADTAALGALASDLPLRLTALEDEGAGEGGAQEAEGFYCAVLEQWVPAALPQVMVMRGEVSRGYGRGSAQLGVPTANLNEADFAGRLQPVPTGVYCGWAVVEGAQGRAGAVVHRAVVNVGYSPTFAGAENAQKIVEAHLLPGGSSGTEAGGASLFEAPFYGAQMRLLLCAYIRPEHKFGQFPLLVGAIHKASGRPRPRGPTRGAACLEPRAQPCAVLAPPRRPRRALPPCAQDIAEAARVLGSPPFSAFARDPFLLMGTAVDGTVGLCAGRGSGGEKGASAALFKQVDFELAHSVASMQQLDEP